MIRQAVMMLALLLLAVRADGGMIDEATPRVGDDRPLVAQRALDGPETALPDARMETPNPPGVDGKRSPVLAGLLSLVLPGAGQFYNGNRSGWFFLGIEAAGWITYASTRQTGQDIETQYKRFADGHWTFERYRDDSFEDCPTNGHSDDGTPDSTLVVLYDTRRDDYYEDIGKLDIYSCGWDQQANREHYRDMRNESNDFLRASRTAGTVVFLNHLVSGILAARGAAKHNASLPGGAELGIQLNPSFTNPGAVMTVSRRF